MQWSFLGECIEIDNARVLLWSSTRSSSSPKEGGTMPASDFTLALPLGFSFALGCQHNLSARAPSKVWAYECF